ncbi:MAG TPA: hypothetical protein DEV98_08800 [Clostridiales bacterium]|nr:hypothetical protein [Clostridiales bacterium]
MHSLRNRSCRKGAVSGAGGCFRSKSEPQTRRILHRIPESAEKGTENIFRGKAPENSFSKFPGRIRKEEEGHCPPEFFL